MATSGHDVNDAELNFLFKSLGERGKEAQFWKEYNTDVTGPILEQISEFLSKESENQIMVRPYGSTAEDLKCLIPEDYGDVDIMIFPNADNCVVYEDLLEYSSENPVHVRIMGNNHPMLRSCLVEGTEYVATSAVKKFHPAIYGTAAPGCIDRLTKVMQAVSREDLVPFPEWIFRWRNEDNSPAIAIDDKQSFETQSEEMQKLIDAKSWYNLDVAQLEFLFIAMNCAIRGVEYKREHAEALDHHCQRMNELLKDWVSNSDSPSGLIRGFPDVVQEIFRGDSTKNFIARVKTIESPLQNENESGSRTDEAVYHVQQPVTPDICDTGEAGSSTKPPRNVPPFVTPQSKQNRQNSNADGQLPAEELKSILGLDSSEDSRQFSEESVTTGECEAAGGTTDRDHNEDGNESKTELKNSTEKGGEISEYGKEEDEKRKNAMIAANKRVFEHMLGLTAEMKEHTEETKEYKRKVGIDIVPALRSRGWPKVAREWIKRQRRWPSPEIVDKVILEGFHLVVKPPKANGNPDCDFRISFSHAEYLLSQEMNDIQRECYRCLKKYHRVYFSKPTGLVTFHLKNLLLQTIEETGAVIWTESNRVECMMKLLGNLLEALTKKDLRHFFVRDYNLFGTDYIDDPKILEVVAREVEKIIESPVVFSNRLMQNQDDGNQIEKKESVPSSKPTVPVKPVSEEGHKGTEKASRPGGNDGTQSKNETLTFPLLNKEATQGRNPTPSYRYHDLEVIYFQVSKELIDMAFNYASLETLDPLERSLVEEVKELASIHGLSQEGFLNMLKCGWRTAYYKVFLNTEPDMRRRMLDTIHGQVEMWKYALKQEDFAPGNEEAIANRMMDPSSEDDPFDLNHVIPAGGAIQYLRGFFNSLTLQPTQQQMVNMDDIPLD